MNERTRLFAVMALAAIILFGWVPLVQFVERTTGLALLPKPPAATQPVDSGSNSTDTATTGGPASTQPAGSMVVQSTQPGSIAIASPTTAPADVLIGSAASKDKQYAMQLRVSPAAGGLSGVVLNDYTERVGSPDPFEFEDAPDSQTLALATRSIKIDGHEQKLAGSIWRVASSDAKSVSLALDVTDGKNPLLTLIKTFEILPREDEGGANGPRGFDTKFSYSFINLSGRPIVVSSDLIGPTFPPSEQPRGGDRQVVAGYQGKNAVILKHDALESFSGSTASRDYTVYENQPLLWFGAGGNYFNAIVRPTGPIWIKSATAHSINPDVEAHLRQVALDLNTGEMTLAAGTTHTLEARVFFGPRKREILKNPYYAAPGLGYQHTLETGGSCAFCTFQWLVDFLMLLLGFFQMVLRDWGLSIIALVFVVRACLHPITKRSQINMAKMGKMGPEIERIKKKYGDDKEGLNKAMMDFYKTQGAAPVLGCLPMFLQMPIWIALYSGLSSTFELRQAPFLYGLTWIKDLSKPDHLIQFSQPINLFGILHFDGLNVIPFLLAGAFFLQQKFTPKPPATTPEQQQQQKMMQWMTLMFPLFLYSSPSGLNMYILTSTIFGIIESRIIRKHIKEREAMAPTGPTFVDGEIIDKDKDLKKRTPEKAGGGAFGWFQKLQEKAEQIRNEAEKKAREKR